MNNYLKYVFCNNTIYIISSYVGSCYKINKKIS